MQRGMILRRITLFSLVIGIAVALTWLVARAMAPGGYSGFEVLTLLAFAGTAPWTALCAANALLGFALLLGSRDAPGLVLPAWRLARRGAPSARTAIVICIRNEEMGGVLPPLERLLYGLRGKGDFRLWFLSDSNAGLAEEEEAIAALATRHAGVHYRRRVENTGFKAGNVMDFCDHHAADAEFMLCLDADSEMSAEAVLGLVACMEADARLAIVQQLIVGRPASAAFPRLFQFGMRAGMRIWATGQAWWQGDEGPYWGHNALIRIAPFREHARLEPLPDGSAILSHDQVEAVRLHAAGWKVAALPIEAGSMEGNPPALPEFMARDLRWGAGNMQYFSLFRLPGMTWMGKWQLAQAILLFAGAPLWVAVLLFSVANAVLGGETDKPALALAMFATWAAQHAPKLLGYAEVLCKPALAASYGGRAAFAQGAALEILFTTLLDPVTLFSKAMFLAVLPFRRSKGQSGQKWAPQNRADRGVAWADAARLLWPHTLFGLAVFALLPLSAWGWALPWVAGLVLAVPLCVVTSSPGVSAWLRARRVAATPEELNPPAAPPP